MIHYEIIDCHIGDAGISKSTQGRAPSALTEAAETRYKISISWRVSTIAVLLKANICLQCNIGRFSNRPFGVKRFPGSCHAPPSVFDRFSWRTLDSRFLCLPRSLPSGCFERN